MSTRFALTAAAALLALGLALTLPFDSRLGALAQGGRADGAAIAAAQKADPSNTATAAEARETCGTACHKFPAPDILPRAA